MTSPTPKRKPVFIEKVMPVKLLNEQVYYEHGGNPFKGLHRWYSRKPLSFCRASVLGSLLPADVTMEEFEYLLGLEPGKEVKLYKTPPSSVRIKKVQDLCEQMWGTRTPTVLDAFAGGGSIPFEAARYGLNVLASDLNPVAVVTMKAAMEYPLKFGPDLQVDIDRWVKWVGDEAQKRLAPFFPSPPGETVQNYLWAHTVVCPNCESVVPLSPNWWVDRSPAAAKKGQWCAVKPIPDPENKRVGFEMVRGKKGKGTTIVYQPVVQASSLPTTSVEQASSLSFLEGDPKLKITRRTLPHWQLDGAVYFVTFNTWHKLEITPQAQQVVLDACRFFDNQNYKIFALVIMPDHVHWLIQPLPKSETEFWSLGSIMHSIKSYSAKQISKVMKHIGTVWQDEWYDRIIRDEREFQDTWEYIRQNPVKAGLSATPEEYLFFWQLSSKVNQSVAGQASVGQASVGQASVGQASSLPSNHLSRGGQDARTTDHQNNVQLEYDPETTTTMSRGVGRCPNCGAVIENDLIYEQGRLGGMNHQLYAVAYRKGKGNLEFRLPQDIDFDGVHKAKEYLEENLTHWQTIGILPEVQIPYGHQFAERSSLLQQGLDRWDKVFNPRQLLTLVTYVEIINEAKALIQAEYEPERAEAITAYLALVLDRCVDKNCRLSNYDPTRTNIARASAQHAFNLMWNYPENAGNKRLWESCSATVAGEFDELCSLFGTKSGSTGIPGIAQHEPKSIQIDSASADNLAHISDKSVDTVVIDPPYYSTIQYAELSDFFYVWMKRNLGDVLPELFWSELTDKDREAVANPSRFRNMGVSPEELANRDYEAKMSLAFAEYYRVLRDDGVMTVQFNHKDSGAWDVLAKSLIDAGFEITASWSVSTENPQNLHQAQKNSVASTVLLVCRKRDPHAGQAWWDDLRPQVANLVEQRAPEFEANDITGIDLYLSAFGPALNVFSQSWPVLDSSGRLVHPDEAFTEARRAMPQGGLRERPQTTASANSPTLTQLALIPSPSGTFSLGMPSAPVSSPLMKQDNWHWRSADSMLLI